MAILAPLAAALALLNLWTVLRFWQDKQRAIAGERRIAESPGALIARSLFRHKTRKQPFSTRLFLIVAIQAGALIGLLVG
jgi:uncharacterized membrane protein YsdA (DUF1294 family)